MPIQNINLNVIPSGVPPIVHVSQNDSGWTILLTLMKGREPFQLFSGYTYTLCGTKPTGTGFSYDDAVSMVGSNVLSFNTNTVMTAVAGDVRCGIIIYDGEEHVETLNFILHVQRTALDTDTIIDTSDFGSVISQAVVDWMDENGVVIDNTLSVSGAAADAKKVGDELSELKSAIDEYFEYKNIVNADFSVTGYVQANGVFTTTQGFLSTELIPIVSDKTTVEGTLQCVRKNISYITYYDANQSVIQVVLGSNASETVEESFYQKVPLGTAYVRFSARQAYVTNTPISIKISSIVNELLFDMNTINYYVGFGINDGIHYFTSLVDCLNEAKNYPDTYKIININRGTYDVLNELGGMNYIMSHTTAEAFADVQPVVSNVKIIGHGTVILTFNIDDGTPNTNYWLFSCLNVRGNVEIENIEIHSSNCRYCIHDESSNNFKDTVHKYKNVRLYQNFYHVGAGGQAFGTGYSENSRVYIEDCVFVNGGGNSSGETYSCHANNGTVFTIDNCIFKRTGTTLGGIRISQNGTAKLYAIISNSFVSNKILIRNEWTDTTIVGQTKMYLVNTNTTVENGYTTVAETVTKYDSINNTEIELISVS